MGKNQPPQSKPQLRRTFEKSEKTAKERETIDLDKVTKEAEKAQKLGYGIHKLRKVNPAPFTQSNSENLCCLIIAGYLTEAEWSLTSKIQALCEMNTNAIVDTITKQFLNVSEIARFLRRDKYAISKLINALLRKGILYEIVNAQEVREYGRPVTERPLYMNPELYFAGNRNHVNAILCKICIKSDILEKKGVKMPWKIWYKSGDKFGQLVTRHTYLKRIQEAKKIRKKEASLKLVDPHLETSSETKEKK